MVNKNLFHLLDTHKSDKKESNKTKSDDKKGTTEDYVKFFTLFLIASIISTIGMYAQLKFPKAGIIKVTSIALIFCVVNWYFMTWAISIRTEKKLFTPTQVTMLLIIVQWVLLLILDYFYLKQGITRSDLIAFPILLFAFLISGKNIISKMFQCKTDSKKKEKDSSSKKHTKKGLKKSKIHNLKHLHL